jgi:hypothetical protein
MVNVNETDFEVLKEVVRGLYHYGVKLGEKGKYLIDQGLVSEENLKVMIMAPDIPKLTPNLPSEAHLYMKLGTSSVGVAGNTVITGAGLYTGGRSALGFAATNSRAAKGCYAMSVMCSTVAVASGGTAVMAKACTLSKQGLLAESCGYAFMKLGEFAHAAALHAEGKPIPPQFQKYLKYFQPPKPIPGSAYAGKYMGFVMPGNGFEFSEIIEKIPFQKIGQVVGVGFTVYGYYRIVVTGYRYSQKLITKYKENRKKIKFKNEVPVQANFLAVSLYSTPSVHKNLLINRFIINNLQVCY